MPRSKCTREHRTACAPHARTRLMRICSRSSKVNPTLSMNTANQTDPSCLQTLHNGSKALPAGAPAPDFALKSTPDQTVRLGEFRGRPVVLAFYPADWSPVCGDQMGLYNEMLSEFQEFDAE